MRTDWADLITMIMIMLTPAESTARFCGIPNVPQRDVSQRAIRPGKNRLPALGIIAWIAPRRGPDDGLKLMAPKPARARRAYAPA